MLRSLGEIEAKFTAAHASVLGRFDAADAHDSDGYGTSASWLAAMADMTPPDAKRKVRRMRLLRDHPKMAEALADAGISKSWALAIAEWTKKLPAELRAETIKILVQAAQAGASRDDLRIIAAVAEQKWRASRPDGDDDGFDDRYVQVGTTFEGAGVIRGNLTPECAAAVQAVLEALGKKAGPEDTRTEGQRFHDALQQGCELLIRAKMVPDRAGADTHVAVHIPFPELRQHPDAPEQEEVWLRGTAGEPGYLLGKDAEAAACDARTTPVVTGHADMRVVDKIIALALAAAGITLDGTDARPGGDGDDDDDAGPDDTSDDGPRSWGASGGGTRAASRARGRARARFTPDAAQALRYAIARLAIDFVSGPAGIAAWLRTTLLAPPYSTPSVPLDIGYSDSIPASIRRAVPERPGLRLAKMRAARRLVRRAPPAAQGRRRQDLRHRLRAAVPVPPRRLHPSPRLAARPPSRRHHHRLRTRRAGPAQPLTTDTPRRVNPAREPHALTGEEGVQFCATRVRQMAKSRTGDQGPRRNPANRGRAVSGGCACRGGRP